MIAAIAGPLGCFMVWRRMAYFGDTLAHAALLGVALGLLFQVNVSLAVVLVCLLLALLLSTLVHKPMLATDTLLGILSHASLSLGLVSLSLFDHQAIDLMGFLFGDLLAIGYQDLVWIALACGLVLGVLIPIWKPLLAITVNEELAQVEGINVAWVRTLLMLLVAIVIAVAMKVVGVLLITSLLIIPAAATRRWSNSPEQMALMASLLGMLSVSGGLALSWFYDTPAGPSVVLVASALFFMLLVAPVHLGRFNMGQNTPFYYAPKAKHMGQLWYLAWPLIISNISVPLLGLVDAAIMGHLDDARYLGAVALGATLLSFIYWAFGFLRMGTVGLTAQAHGAKDKQRLTQLLLIPGLFALIIGGVIMALQGWLIPLGVNLMGASVQVSALAQEYLSIRIYSAPAVLITYVCLGWLLGRQDSFSPLALLVVTNVSNIGFNLLFVIGFDMTSAGVAWGSLLADYCGLLLALVLVWRHLAKLDQKLHLDWSTFPSLAKQLIQLNSYLFVRTLMLLFAFAFITSQSARMGDDVLAANTLLLQYVTLLAYALDGFAFAIEAACGEALGAKHRRRFYQLCNAAAIYSILVAVASTVGFWLLSGAFINLLTTIESVRQLAGEQVPWVMWVPLISVWSYLFDGIFVGATQAKAMFYSVLASLVALLPLFYLLEPWGNDGLWWAFLGFCGVRALAALVGYLWLSHQQAWFVEA